MGVSVEWVSYGSAAAERLRSEVAAAKVTDPLSPVTVIVPSNHVGVATRRLLASGRVGPVSPQGVGMAAVSFLTVYRLAELLASARLASSGRRPVSTAVIAAALRAVLADAPGIFEPVAGHPATEEALVHAYRELRDVGGRTLDAVAGAGPRALEVVRIHRAARDRLEPDWYDEEDLMGAAVDLLDSGPVAAGLGRVIAFLPQRLSLHGAALLRAVGERSNLIVLAGTTGLVEADADVAATVMRLAPTPLPPAARDVSPVVDAGRTRFVTASDADEEVRHAVRAVIEAARTGVPLGRIALLYASPVPYARLIHEQLSAAGIAANGAAVVPLAERTAGRVLLRLLEWPSGGYRRWDLFAWLAASPLRDSGRPISASSWERLSRDAEVVAGRSDWDHLLDGFASRLDAQADSVARNPDGPAWTEARMREDATRARRLRQFALGLIGDLEEANRAPRRWPDHARWAKALLSQLLGGPAQERHWAPAEQKAAERVDAALDRLAAIDAVEGPVDLAVFSRTLRLVLDADLGRVGRFGEGVLVGSVTMGVGLDLDVVVLLGLAEGTFPAVASEDALLGDTEREASHGELATRRGRIHQQHRELLAALAAARRHVISVPRGDLRRNVDRVPSRWVLDLASGIAGERWWADDFLGCSVPWVDHVASFDAGLRRASFPATEQEYRLASLVAGGRGASDTGDEADPVRWRGSRLLDARRSPRFTRFDGNVAGMRVPKPSDGSTTASRLEQWTACPFSYLLSYVLRVNVPEDPAMRLRISALDKGELIHAAMERFIVEVLARPADDQPRPTDAWSDVDHLVLRRIAESLCDDYEQRGLTGRRMFWDRDRAAILRDLRRVLTEDSAQRRAAGTRPVAAELGFGLPGTAIGPVALSLPAGTLSFRGRADRVDVAEDGTLHVIDYKTGSPKDYKGLSVTNPVLGGKKLQLPIYGQAARVHAGDPNAVVRAEYWFVSGRGKFERLGFMVNEEALRLTGEALASIVTGIESGVFPHHPSANSTTPWTECPYCDPDGFGATELRRAWERKVADPAMAIYVELAEPALATQRGDRGD